MFRTSTINAVYSIKTFGDTADLVGGEDPNEKVYKGEALMSLIYVFRIHPTIENRGLSAMHSVMLAHAHGLRLNANE